jgi:hypothetical protein
MTEHRFYTGTYATYSRARPAGLTPVRITVGTPRITGAEAMAAVPLLMGRGLTWPPIDLEHFGRAYQASLTRTGAARIGRALDALTVRHRPLILLDFGGRYSHRRIFAAWWTEQTGERIPEFHSFYSPRAVEDENGLAADRQLALI